MTAQRIGDELGACLVEVVVPGQPVGKGRPRASVQRGRVRMRTPPKTAAWEAFAAAWARVAHRGRAPIEEAVGVEVVAVLTRPKRLMRKKDAAHRLIAPVKPDIDNVCKAAIDALVLAGVLADDNQVVELVASKWYAAKDEDPSVVIRVCLLGGAT
jgi:Holliday junction resolvase RusA-like endonuclease